MLTMRRHEDALERDEARVRYPGGCAARKSIVGGLAATFAALSVQSTALLLRAAARSLESFSHFASIRAFAGGFVSTTALRDSTTKPALACETMAVRNSKFYVPKFGMSCQIGALNLREHKRPV